MLNRAWNGVPTPITGAVLATMRGGLSGPSVRCSSRVGGASSAPMPVVAADTHHVPAWVQDRRFVLSSACTVNVCPAAARSSATGCRPCGPVSVREGSRLVLSSVATVSPTRNSATAGAGRSSRSMRAEGGRANTSLPNGPTVPPAQPSASTLLAPARRWKG